MYQENVDSSGNGGGVLKTEKSLEELRWDSANLHRIVGHDPYSVSVQINITSSYNHLCPVSGADIDDLSKNNSKL